VVGRVELFGLCVPMHGTRRLSSAASTVGAVRMQSSRGVANTLAIAGYRVLRNYRRYLVSFYSTTTMYSAVSAVDLRRV